MTESEGPQSFLEWFEATLDRSNLTNSQLLIWLGQQMARNVPLYNTAFAFHLRGVIDPKLFRAAFQTTLDRTDALRSVFAGVRGVPVRRVHPRVRHDLESIDLTGKREPEAWYRRWLDGRRKSVLKPEERPFDTALVRLGPEHFVWYLNQHHLVNDAWSTRLVYERTLEFYRRASAGLPPDVTRFPTYEAHVEEERRSRQSNDHQELRAFWNEKIPPSLRPARFYGAPGPESVDRRGTARRHAGRRQDAEARRPRAGPAHPTSFAAPLTAESLRHRPLRVSVPDRQPREAVRRHDDPQSELDAQQTDSRPLRRDLSARDGRLGERLVSRAVPKGVTRDGGAPASGASGTSSPANIRAANVLLNYVHVSFPKVLDLPVSCEHLSTDHAEALHALRLTICDLNETGRLTLEFELNRDTFDAAGRDRVPAEFLSVLDEFLQAGPEGSIRG